ncbi:hypothetical protein RUM44_006023 [Polyplax serrata]|uniref:Conserved oligomeric Golgi complex subunit 1 n=1 Tax=Polyplax serrata TaxID=468196 RepID=A0ABR1B0M4_POLSC
MPAQTILDVNCDQLFETHTIPEIRAIDTQIQNEIEKKREELRTMVGEKCRDLLKAADTITEMKGTSENFLTSIGQMKQMCQALQEKRLMGFRQPSYKVPAKSSYNSEEISRIIEVRILLTLPEKIWTAIDNKDYLLGAQLFLFASHLHLGLEVCPNAQAIANKYVVLGKQWEVITNCKKIIIDGSCTELKNINTSNKKATEYLCALILLDVMSYEKLLNLFLELRMTTLNEILKSEELSRRKLRQTVELLQQSLVIVNVCFLDTSDKKSSIQIQLESITGDEGRPTLSKVIQISSLPEQHLSPLVLNFRPKTYKQLTPLSLDHIRRVSSTWLSNVEKLFRVEITKILLLVDDIRRLHKIIKEEVLEVEYPKNWNETIQSTLGLNSLNIYQKFLKSFVMDRIKELIQTSWQNSLNDLLVYLNKVDEDILKDRAKQPENDIVWFVWKENKVDVAQAIRLKTLGYTPRVMELCNRMDTYAVQLLEDVKLYVGEDPIFKSINENDNSEANLILPFLNAYSLEMIQRLTHFIKESCKGENSEGTEYKIIIRARFLSSLATQCPGLEKCLRQNIHLEEESSSNNLWQQATGFLNSASNQMWGLWQASTSVKLKKLIKSSLSPTISVGNLLKSKLLSEIITIEEQTEDGTSVKSDLKVPSQPCLPLQELLFQACQNFNAVAPHTVPRQIHQDLVDAFIKDILEHYQEWCKSEVIYQSQAWQMLLDVKFLTLMFVTKMNKDLSESICETLEKMIDPFDLDVYYPHLQNSVKKSTQKLQGTFGVLVNFSEKLPVFNGLKLSQASSNSMVEEPNLLAASTSVPWFPLLPVTNFGARKQDTASRFEGQDVYSAKYLSPEKSSPRGKEKENKKESVTSDFFKSAGAFFDAMTGGWT